MSLRDYINKNLPQLNWNILPQLFEEEGVELTDKIKAYLRKTPENTNWAFLKEWGIGTEESSSELITIFSGEITLEAVASGEPENIGIFISSLPIKGESLMVSFNNEEYELPLDYAWGYGEFDKNLHMPIFTTYPCAIQTAGGANTYCILVPSTVTGTYEVTVRMFTQPEDKLPKKMFLHYGDFSSQYPFPIGCDFIYPSELYQWLEQNYDEVDGERIIGADKLVFVSNNIISPGRYNSYNQNWNWDSTGTDEYCFLNATEMHFGYDN